MSIAALRRHVKNAAYNYSDAVVKVREATSNDPWGPSSVLMSQIANLTHDPASLAEIMSVIWKRLNDSGKNWRHVHKSLLLLEYLIKCGSSEVAEECREKIYMIETLKDFEHVEESSDMGKYVRERSKKLVLLLNDAEELNEERRKSLSTREKLAACSSLSSSAVSLKTKKESRNNEKCSNLQDLMPSSEGEEDIQLQIAIALSKEENEKDLMMRNEDEAALQMAVVRSNQETGKTHVESSTSQTSTPQETLTRLSVDDLLSLDFALKDCSTRATACGSPVQRSVNLAPLISFSIVAQPADGSCAKSVAESASSEDAWISSSASSSLSPKLRNFLGENSSLVNLENLFGVPCSSASEQKSNPFLTSGTAHSYCSPLPKQQMPPSSSLRGLNMERSASDIQRPVGSLPFSAPNYAAPQNCIQNNPFLM